MAIGAAMSAAAKVTSVYEAAASAASEEAA
jgi:hypothetical protein